MSTAPVGNNVNPLSWLSVLNEVNGTTNAEAAQQVSDSNRSVTFTATVNGVVTTVTMKVPDDLDLPSEVTPEAIDNLMAKLVAGDFNLTQTQLLAIKSSITKTYTQMACALATVQSGSTGRVMCDLYQLMALLVEVAQSQRNAARDLRNSQNQQIQNSIQAQADSQRNAAIVGLVVGVTCGVISAAVSVGMLAGQAVSYKGQINAARSSGVEATQNQVTMLQNADTPEHAQAQLAKVEAGIKTEGLASGVKNTITGNTADAKAKFLAAKNIEQKQANVNDASAQLTEAKQVESQAADVVKTKEAELATATGELNKEAKTEELLGVEIPPVKIEGDKTPAMAKAEYVAKFEAVEREPPAGVLRLYDEAITAQGNLDAAKATHVEATQTVEQKTQAKTTAETELAEAKSAVPEGDPKDVATARAQYRKALEQEAKNFATDYENAIAQKAPKAEIAAARDRMHVARAYVNSELMGNNPETVELKSTPTEYSKALGDAKESAVLKGRALEHNMDFKSAMRRIEMFGGINAINTAIGNMLQSMTQSISGSINSEATRMGAEQQKEQEQLDQTKDLFNQAQSVVDAAVQLMNAVRQAETQSMRDAIQA